MVVGTVAIGATGSAEGAPTPKVNGDAAGEMLLASEKPALASAVDDDDDDDGDGNDCDGNDCDADDDDALAGPAPSQAAHLLSWLELRTLHVPHFHDSAGSPLELGGTAHEVVDHIPPFGMERTTATLSALSAADSTSEEESGACSQRTNQSAKSATHKWSALSALDAAMRRSSDPCDSALYVVPNRVISRQITPPSSSCTAAATDMSTVSVSSPPTTAHHASTACWSSAAMSSSSSASSSSSLT